MADQKLCDCGCGKQLQRRQYDSEEIWPKRRFFNLECSRKALQQKRNVMLEQSLNDHFGDRKN